MSTSELTRWAFVGQEKLLVLAGGSLGELAASHDFLPPGRAHRAATGVVDL